MAKATFRLRMYASGLGIDKSRRDELVNIADELLSVYSKNLDTDWLAHQLVSSSNRADETRFLCHTVDILLKRRFNAAYGPRSAIFAALTNRCSTLIKTASKDPLS